MTSMMQGMWFQITAEKEALAFVLTGVLMQPLQQQGGLQVCIPRKALRKVVFET